MDLIHVNKFMFLSIDVLTMFINIIDLQTYLVKLHWLAKLRQVDKNRHEYLYFYALNATRIVAFECSSKCHKIIQKYDVKESLFH